MKTRLALAALPLAAATVLAACAQEEDTTYEADATDVSGGELVVDEPTPGEVTVDLPEAAMTPVPETDVETDEVEPPTE